MSDQRWAIVGGGMLGLGLAHLLQGEGRQVTCADCISAARAMPKPRCDQPPVIAFDASETVTTSCPSASPSSTILRDAL